MSSSLGFKLSVAGGGTAATASAAAGGLYLSSSSDSPSTNDSLVPTTENKPQQSIKNPEVKDFSPLKVVEPKQVPSVTAIRKTYSKASTGPDLGPDTIGGRYYFFLAGTSIDQSVDEGTKASYIEWWNQKYSLWKTDGDNKKDTQFQGITEGFSDTDNKALNKVCEAVYKLDDPFKPNEARVSPQRTVSDLENNYWRYCSDLDKKPESLVETNEYDNGDNSKVGHYDGYGHVLAAIGEEYNNQFWKLKQSWYESLIAENSEIDNNFKTYAESKGNEGKENGKVSLRKVCKTIKDLDRESLQGNLTLKAIVKYCGFAENLFKEIPQHS